MGADKNSDGPVTVSYKPKTHTGQEFMVLCSSGMVERWRKDKTIALAEVVQKFEVYVCESGGATGNYIRPSKQALENTFSSSKIEEVIQKILTEGQIKGAKHKHKEDFTGNSWN